MLKLLPEFKAMVLNNIRSSISYEQLLVCHEMIELFRLRYSGFLGVLELHNHMLDIQNAYDQHMVRFLKTAQA